MHVQQHAQPDAKQYQSKQLTHPYNSLPKITSYCQASCRLLFHPLVHTVMFYSSFEHVILFLVITTMPTYAGTIITSIILTINNACLVLPTQMLLATHH